MKRASTSSTSTMSSGFSGSISTDADVTSASKGLTAVNADLRISCDDLVRSRAGESLIPMAAELESE